MQYITLSQDKGVTILTLDAPDTAVNTVSPAWVEEMAEAFARIASDETVKGVIITSAKPGFMAGADLKYILSETARMSPRDAYAFSQHATNMHRQIETCGKPVVAALNGFALGGGYELALACHHRILADAKGAVVGLPEVNVGLLPGSGGTQRLARLIGVKKALDVLLTGNSYTGAAALELGLVDELVSPGELIPAAKAWIEASPQAVQPWDVPRYQAEDVHGLLKLDFANLMTMKTAELSAKNGSNYPAPISILTCVSEGIQCPIDGGLRIESRHFAHLLTNPVARNIIRTTFINRGRARKGLHRPDAYAPFKASRIAVLGAGLMGAGIAFVAARNGIDVVLLDRDQASAEKGKAYSESRLGKEVAKGRLDEAGAAEILDRITPTVSYDELKGCQLVVEAVFEDTAIKADVVKQAEAVLDETAIFATNTSTLPITELAMASARPERFIGLHFFSPVERMELVEVIRGKATSDETLAYALDFVAQLRKTPIVVNDSRGFYTSRVFQTFIHEGAAMLGEGINPALIENSAKMAGMPIGPLALLDEVTMDLPLKIVDQAIEAEGSNYQPPCGVPVMKRMQGELGRASRKSGGGFYDYPDGGGKQLWPGLSEAFPRANSQPDAEELKTRFLYAQALETARCYEDNVLTDPADGDLGAVLGWGFPGWTGGTLSFIDTIGLETFVATCDRLAQAYGPRFAPTEGLRKMAASGERFHAQ